MFKKLFDYRMRSGIASVVVLVCLAWAGMNFNASGEAEFVEVEAALENAIAGSDGCNPTYGGLCCQWNDSCRHPYGGLVAESIWVPGDCYCI
jgi:hypothetical protein